MLLVFNTLKTYVPTKECLTFKLLSRAVVCRGIYMSGKCTYLLPGGGADSRGRVGQRLARVASDVAHLTVGVVHVSLRHLRQVHEVPVPAYTYTDTYARTHDHGQRREEDLCTGELFLQEK